MVPDAEREARARLSRARLMLIFTPELCREREPLDVLEALLPEVDLVQIRPKPLAREERDPRAAGPPGEARASHRWCAQALELAARLSDPPLVLVNDRVDVALALSGEGLAGVHLGEHDLPPREARALLGPQALIGLSTHDMLQVAAAAEEPVDYLGFGPVFATSTKGYARGLGPEAAWIAAQSSALPLFAIGGITLERALELERVGRAAVGSALLDAEDPVRAARSLRALLEGG